LTVSVVTKPFSFEGLQRMKLSEIGLEELRREVDALVVIPNDRLLAIVDKDTTVKNAFAMCDEVLRQAVEGIADLITTPGIINVDFADIRSVMENAGSALMGIGVATGEKRAEEAAQAAINSPLLELSINGAKGVLFSVAGGDDLTMLEVQDAARVITESIDPNAKVIFGTARDDSVKKNEIKVTVIATGFPSNVVFSASAERAPSSLFGGKKGEETQEEQKNLIYNTINVAKGTKSKPAPQDGAEGQSKQQTTTPKKDGDDDDWNAVPSFLRRSKLK